ncbi:MAG: DUF4363 family protein [Oscillospiraceae bacterium]|nr:DUF4363 family protein [Oscillospiraceae bacterium]
MKHAIISAICVVLVLAYSFFTMLYVNDFSRQINGQLTASAETGYIDTDKIKDIYEDKKSVLTFILNRDHTDEMENIITNLDSAVKYNDKKDISTNISLLKTALDGIVKSNSFTI